MAYKQFRDPRCIPECRGPFMIRGDKNEKVPTYCWGCPKNPGEVDHHVQSVLEMVADWLKHTKKIREMT